MIPLEFNIENRYQYSHLSEANKRLYRFMVSCLLKKQRRFLFIDEFDEVLDKDEYKSLPIFNHKSAENVSLVGVWNAIMWDCPEFYFVDIFDLNSLDPTYVIMGKVDAYYTDREIDEINEELEEILHNFDGITDEFELELAVTKFISKNYTYDNETIDYYVDYNDLSFDINKWKRYKEKYSVAGLIKYKTGVCSAMALLAQFIFQRKGMKVVNMEGRASNSNGVIDGHRWLAVNLEGDYYYLDVTWENTLSKDLNNPQFMFFNIDSKEALEYYQIYENEYNDVICDSTKYNYYHKMGRYFDSLSKLKKVFEKYLLTNFDTNVDNYFYFKISNDLIDGEVRKSLLEIKNKYWDASWKWKVRKINSYYSIIIPVKKDL